VVIPCRYNFRARLSSCEVSLLWCVFLRFFFIVFRPVSFSLHAMVPLLANKDEYISTFYCHSSLLWGRVLAALMKAGVEQIFKTSWIEMCNEHGSVRKDGDANIGLSKMAHQQFSPCWLCYRSYTISTFIHCYKNIVLAIIYTATPIYDYSAVLLYVLWCKMLSA